LSDILSTWWASIVLAPAAVYLLLSHGDYTILDAADLVIHEAGHVFFAFFGEFIRFAGGTLMQVLLPATLLWFFAVRSWTFGAQFSLFWLGQNLLNISVYAADARAQELPLLGGRMVQHDWAYMLGQLGLLEFDQLVGQFYVVLAIGAFIAAAVLPRFMMNMD
jgi:hypothetical protein